MLLKKASFYILNGCIKRRFYPNYFWVQKSISPLNFFSTGQVKTMNFNEKAFMMKFLEVTQNRGNFNQEQIQSLMTELNQNLDSISKPNSYAALLHKIQYLHKHANSELINKLVTNSITVFKQNYDCSDNGDLLKAVILVVCLQKINNPSFFKEFSRIVLKNIPKISFFNLLTILESYSYNKWLFKCFSIDESTNLLKSFANKINPTQFSHLPKLCTVLYFIFKNSKYELNSEEAAKIINQVEIIINILYDNLLQMFIQDRATKTMDLFVLTDIIIALNPFNTMSNKLAGKYSLLSKQYDGIVNEYLSRSKGAVIPIKYDLKAVISFVKRYYVTPPQEINPKMSGLINQIFWLHYNDRDFKHLENYVYFILFLLKTDSFNPPKQYSLPLFDLISQEKNLLILAKALEIYVLNEKSGKISFAEKTMELKAIEKIIFDIINRLPKENIVAGPLVQIFQSMVALNIGDLDKWKLLFKLFSEEEIRKLDYVDLIIKLIPAAAIKTKSIYKIYSNISSSGSSQHIKGPRVDPEFAQLLKKFWISIENIIIEKFEDIQFDKLPTILFYLVYANLFDSRYTKIFSLAKQKVEKNIEKFDPKQLVEIAYAYSRVGQKDSDSLFFLISSQILSTNAISQLGPIELSNLYWALSHSRIWNKKFNELAEAKLFSWVPQMTLESLTEFCQGLALQDKRLTESEKKALNLKTKEFLNQTKKDETMAYNIQNFFGIINSFNIMENYNDKELWELFLEMVLDRKEQIEASGLLLHYIHTLYIHLVVNDVSLRNRAELLAIIQKNYHKIVNYLKFSKKQVQSQFEMEVKKILRENQIEYFGKDSKFIGDDVPLVVFKHPYHEFIFLNDIKSFDKVESENKEFKFGSKNMIIPYSVDILVDHYAIEVNGPSHYLHDQQGNLKENGFNSLKRRLLEKIGLIYTEIPYNIYAQHQDKKQAITYCLENAKRREASHNK